MTDFCGPSLCQQCTHCTWLKCYWGMCTLAFTVTFPQCIMSTMHTLHLALVLLGNVCIGLHCNYWRTYAFWTRRGVKSGFSNSVWGSHILLAACRRNEYAREEGEQGIFTGALLKSLKHFAAGDLPPTYDSLMKHLNMPD